MTLLWLAVDDALKQRYMALLLLVIALLLATFVVTVALLAWGRAVRRKWLVDKTEQRQQAQDLDAWAEAGRRTPVPPPDDLEPPEDPDQNRGPRPDAPDTPRHGQG